MSETFDHYRKTRVYLKKIGTGVNLSDIKVGDIYHIPPLLGVGRKTVVVEEIGQNRIKCLIEDSFGYVHSDWIYDFETQSKYFLPYKYNLNK